MYTFDYTSFLMPYFLFGLSCGINEIWAQYDSWVTNIAELISHTNMILMDIFIWYTVYIVNNAISLIL